MLIRANALHQLRFGQLMEVYREGNQKNGAEFWPSLPRPQQLLQAEQDFYAYLQQVFFATPGACYYVWEEQGRYVSALRVEPYRDGLLLQALETSPELRGRGYGTTLIEAVQLCHSGDKIYSHVGKQNAASLAVHLRCGFMRLSETAVYLDGSANDRCCTLLWQSRTDKER